MSVIPQTLPSDYKIRDLQLVELEILKAIAEVCAANGIQYFLDSGTLLGAARHSGFIPWDDDLDIAMPRADYERFLQIAPEALSPRYFVQTRATDRKAPFSFAKVRKNGTLCVEYVTGHLDMHQGIWVDIFPFDWIEAGERNFSKKKRQWRFWHKLYSLRNASRARPGTGLVRSVARRMIRVPICALPLDFYINKLHALADDVEHPETNGWLTCFDFYTVFFAMPYADVFPAAELEFEGSRFPVVRNWDGYLTSLYGDWRTPVPEKDRHPGHAMEVLL